jgi:hypothetical protein
MTVTSGGVRSAVRILRRRSRSDSMSERLVTESSTWQLSVLTAARLFVPIVRAALATLGGRLPGIRRVAKLPLGQLVETFLLTSQQFELVLALLGVKFGGIDVADIGRGRALAGPAQPPQELHDG